MVGGGGIAVFGINSKFINNNILTLSGGTTPAQNGGEITNSISGTINIQSGADFYAVNAGDIITNNGTIKVSGVDSYARSQLGSTFTNNSSGIIYVYDNGSLNGIINNGTIYTGLALPSCGLPDSVNISGNSTIAGCPP